MDAIVAFSTSQTSSVAIHRSLILMAVCALFTGCEGKSLVDDNPVFTAAPPRRSLTNRATAEVEPAKSAIKTVSYADPAAGDRLTGNSVVAEVNGTPIFVDDLIGSLRLSIEADERLTPEKRQSILYAQVKGRLNNYVEQEIVIQALHKAIPEDRRQVINDSLEEPFQDVINNIKKDRNVETDHELNEILGREGLSVDLLRESFVRLQMVQGYLQTLVTAPEIIDRADLLEYYQEHRDDFTTDERVRWQELVVRFDRNGGRDSAEERMADAVDQLNAKADFGEIAMKYSDALSAERRGDMGWLEVGGLADKDLEKTLFELNSGQMTKVYVRDDRFELYRVVDHEQAKTSSFNEVQSDIERKLKQQIQAEARKEVMEDLRSEATVVSMFDGVGENPSATKR